MRVHTTGSFAVHSRRSGQEITPRGRKARALLAYLVCDAGTKMSKDRLSALLWADRADAQARASLRQVLLELRRALNTSYPLILSDREHIWVAPDRVIEDPPNPKAERREAFEDLDNITAEFDEWLTRERCRRSASCISELRTEAEALLASGQGVESSEVIAQIQSLDPCNEEALRLGMEADFQRANPGAVAERYRVTAEHMRTDLGVEPSTKDRALRDRLISRLTEARCADPLHEPDHAYFARRASEEHTAAFHAASEKAREAHKTLARRYQEMADATQ